MSNVIDLSQVPAPDVVETIDYENVFAARLADFQSRYPDYGPVVDSDPVVKVLEESAYRETVLRQRINESAAAVMLPYASGADLDVLVTRYNIQRLLITPSDPDAVPPKPAVYESDADLRERALLSLDGLSVAGPERAYIFHARSASGDVLDASAIAPQFEFVQWLDNGNMELRVIDDAGLDKPIPGNVRVSTLSRTGSGQAPQALLDTVLAALSDDDVRPLTDVPVSTSAEIVEFAIDATIYVYAGPDAQVVLDQSRAAAAQYVSMHHRLGHDITLSGLYAALNQPGVQRVEMTSPTETLVISKQQASYCTSITVTLGGVDE